ncbi:MAG: FG-GAP-like repeat-containing protein, partial [Kiritimatiellota bacterium]|nr:FG-GAP-like repeat-containing protein [Kiritimatiellota bacterium]
KTVAMNLKDLDPYSKFRVWYLGANTDGSPDETTASLLFDNNSPSVIRTDGRFNNFKLTDSISVAGDFHVALDIYEGSYLGIYYDTGDPAAGRSWYKLYDAYGNHWAKFTESNNLMIKVIYETTPLSAPAAPTLGSPANGATLNNWLVTFSWNAVSGADRYFLEANSSPSWDSAARVYFETVTDVSKQVSGFPVGVNYWRVYAGNADAWSSASETRAFTQLASPPQLACSTTTLAPRAVRNQNAASQSFDVWNSGNGSISYSITENSDWLSVTPGSGASSGERDTIQVNYNTSGLAAGNYTATITVTASGAVGSPATIAVTLTVSAGLPVTGDFDGDGLADSAMVDGSGNWYIWMSAGGYSRSGPFPLTSAGMTPIAGDFDGDRKADPVGVDASGNWTIYMSLADYAPTGPAHLTAAGLTPIVADFDGDRIADAAGMDSAGNWTICLSLAGYAPLGPLPLTVSGGTPVAADFDGDRLADPAVANSSGNWTICMSSGGYVPRGPFLLTGANRMAVAGDFDGDGLGDPTAVDSSGNWYICMSLGGYAQQGPFPMTLP